MPQDPERSKLPERAGMVVELAMLVLMIAAIIWLVVRSGNLLALW